MTSESAGQTEPWIEKHGAKYAYAYDKGSKLSSALGVTGLPTAVLVDASGTVAWVGHPSSLNESIVEKHLDGALSKPVWEWSKKASKVKKAVLENELGKALSEVEKLGEEFTDIKTAIRGMIDGKLASVQAAKEAGDWMRVDDLGSGLKKAFSGLPELETVKTILADLKSDKAAQKVLAGQRKVAKIFSKEIKRKDIPKMEKQLKAIAESNPLTAAARDANAGLKRLSGMKRKKR